MDSFQLLYRYLIASNPFAGLLEATHDNVIVGRRTLRRYTLRGVPARRVDVLVDEEAIAAERPLCLEVGEKAGRYDGAIRRRYTVRRHAPSLDAPPCEIAVSASDTLVSIDFSPSYGVPWFERFDRLPSDLQAYNLARVCMWHARRYYTHLRVEEDCVGEFADAWAADARASGESDTWTLAEANRAASRALYRLSRSLGWRKLTLRERTKLGLHAESQWVSDEVVARAWERLGSLTGCGDETIEQARGSVESRIARNHGDTCTCEHCTRWMDAR